MSADSSPRTDKPREGLDTYESVYVPASRGRGALRGAPNSAPSLEGQSESPMLSWEHLVGSRVILTTQENQMWMATLAKLLAAAGTEDGHPGAILHNARDLNSRSALVQERVFVPVQLIANCVLLDPEIVLQQPMPAVQTAVTRLLVATKYLLESLTQWSIGQISENDVSDLYVRMGNDFNSAVAAFQASGIDMTDLMSIPDGLRSVLEQALSEEATPENLDLYLPGVRAIVKNLLEGLRAKQHEYKFKVSGSRRSSPDTTDERYPRLSAVDLPLPDMDLPDVDLELLTEPEENNIVGPSHRFTPNEKQRPAQKKQAIVKSEEKKGMVEIAASAQASEGDSGRVVSDVPPIQPAPQQSAWGNNTSPVSYPPHQMAPNQSDEQAHTQLHPIVNSMMTSTEIAGVLASHDCTDLTQHLDLKSCSTNAVSNGGFGEVYSGRLTNGTPVAIKVFRLHFVRESRKYLKHAARELHTWSKCQHPNVLRLLGFVEFREQIGMVSPWMGSGSLLSYLARWPNANRYQLCYGISDGVAYLHDAGVIHGDIKGANVLISDDGVPLITDFGNASLNDQSLQFTHTTTQPGFTARWAAPEVLEGSVKLSYPADVFSLGMTLLEAMTGEVPYYELQERAVFVAIVIRRKVPSRPEAHIPTGSERGDRLWSLLEKCWDFDNPEHRPKAGQVRDTMLEIMNIAVLVT